MRTLAGSLMFFALFAYVQQPAPPPAPAAPITVAAPSLTSEEKLQLQNAVQRIEIAQLKFESARNELVALLQKLDKPGYTLNLQTLAYDKKEEPKDKKE